MIGEGWNYGAVCRLAATDYKYFSVEAGNMKLQTDAQHFRKSVIGYVQLMGKMMMMVLKVELKSTNRIPA